MSTLRLKWSSFLDQQHRYPTGCIGQFIGERMLRQHTPETDWSIALLDLHPTDRVLEVGFGAGRGLQLVLQQGVQAPITGVDLSTTMIQAAAQRNTLAYIHGQLSLVRGDVAYLPFHDHAFNKIVSIHTFYFWPDQYATLLALLLLLTTGGRLVTTFATAHTTPTGERAYWQLHTQAEALAHDLQHYPEIRATLVSGPDSRQFNNIALVVDKL